MSPQTRSTRVPRRDRPVVAVLAWGLAGVAVLAWVAAIWLALLRPAEGPPFRVLDAVWGLSFLAFPVVGAIIASRQPRNVVGWVFCTGPVATGVGVACFEYVTVAARPGTGWVGVLGTVCFQAGMATLGAFALLFFPDGRLPSHRWRLFALSMFVAIIAFVVAGLLRSPTFDDAGQVANPLFAASIAPVITPVATVTGIVLFVGGVVGALSLIPRYRRGSAITRRQLQVLLYVVGAVLVLLAVNTTIHALHGDGPAVEMLGTAIFVVGLLGIPSGIAVAILRYRLYDIDRIVSRTLSYGVVSAVLVATYALLVFLLQPVLRPLTGGSDLAVAASTLAVAAAFGPVRRRVQRLVDRRFNRARYDAARTIERFGQRLRDELDLGSLARELQRTAWATVQPRYASVWLPAPPPRPADGARGERRNVPVTLEAHPVPGTRTG